MTIGYLKRKMGEFSKAADGATGFYVHNGHRIKITLREEDFKEIFNSFLKYLEQTEEGT